MSGLRLEGKPGVLAVVTRPSGERYPVAECARCGLQKPVRGRGLCFGCRSRSVRDGTISEYGYTRADRLADYVKLRRGGLGPARAAARIGVTERTAHRYEAALREAS